MRRRPRARPGPTRTSLGRAVNGDQTHVYLPLKGGTYLARAYDSLGNMSAVASVTTKQASVLAFSAVDELVEDPTFPGSHDGTEVLGGVLQLLSAATSTPSPTPTSSSTGISAGSASSATALTRSRPGSTSAPSATSA